MKFLKVNAIFVLVNIFFIANCPAKTVEFIEGLYAMQAPDDLVAVAEKAAALVDFDKAFEVAVPKKPGIQINPLNRFMYGAINPQTNNVFILINPQWFATLSHDQQLFLAARALLRVKDDLLSAKILHYFYIFLTILLGLIFFLLLRKTRLVVYGKWLSALVAFLMVVGLEIVILDACEAKIVLYLWRKHDIKIHEIIIEKTQNRPAGIEALEAFDKAINDALIAGVTFQQPLVNLFADYANELKK